MKKMLLILSILSIGLVTQAQQKVSNMQYINLQTNWSKYDSLYNGQNYDYYNAIFKKATKQRNAGIVLTSAGVGLFAASLIASNTNLNTTTVLFISSVGVIGIGVPLWISGGVKRTNNRRVMEQINRSSSISFRMTNNGVGLVLNF